MRPVPLALLLVPLSLPSALLAAPEPPSFSGLSAIDNGVIRLGVNLDIGGAITWMSLADSEDNVINSADWGRQVQMSFYSGPNPFTPEGVEYSEHWKGLGWNPIQSGDCYGFRSRVLEHTNDGRTIYTKCIPMHWPLKNYPGECTFEEWITLDGPAAIVRCRINNNRPDKTQYSGRDQECPAVYTNGPLYRLVTYSGDKPFTGDALREIIPKGANSGLFPWTGWSATENWAALLRDDDFGLGVWNEGAYHTIGGFAGKPGRGGPKDGPTGYISPLHVDILDWNIVYEYSYVLILGDLQQIREYVYQHAKRPEPPNYVFAKDRQHWTYVNAKDTGWPVQDELHVLPGENDPQMIGPLGFWKAEEAPVLYIRAAYAPGSGPAEVFFSTSEAGFRPERSARFDTIPDGEYHTYAVDLSACPGYRGNITRLRFDPVGSGGEGQWVKVKSIGFREPEGGA